MRNILYISILIFTGTLFSAHLNAATSNRIRYRKVFGREYLYLTDVARYYGMKCSVGKKKSILTSKYSKIIFTYDKRKVIFNGTIIHLLHAPFLQKWTSFISKSDFLLLIDPLLRYKALPNHKMKVIMIDPGHGGKDTGAQGKLYKEKDIVLKISRKLKALLTKKGYRVIMTRNSDKFISLERRSELCKSMQTNIFISIHCNAGSSKVKGIETFLVTPSGGASTSDTKPVWKKEKGNHFDKNNARLAYEVQRNLLKATKAPDRGVKHARFAVIKNASCPAILVETGFLSNPLEEQLLATDAYQTKIAVALANAVLRYHIAQAGKQTGTE